MKTGKFKNRKGESLAETLVSVLVIVLSLTMLAAAIAGSRNIITKSETAMNEYYTASDSVVLQSGASSDDGKISVTPGSSADGVFFENDADIAVYYYSNDSVKENHPVISYREK